MSSNKTFPVNLENPTTHEVIGSVLATKWIDPLSGYQYDVPAGYDPQKTVERFSTNSTDVNVSLPDRLSGTSLESHIEAGLDASIELARVLVSLTEFRAGDTYDL